MKQSYEFEATPVMDRRRPPLVSQNTVTGVPRLDDEDEKNKTTGMSILFIICRLLFWVLGIPHSQSIGPIAQTEDKEKPEPVDGDWKGLARPQRPSSTKPRSLVQPLPSSLTPVPSLTSIMAPIASPEVVA